MATTTYAIGETLTTPSGGPDDSTVIAPYDLLVADSKTPTAITEVVITYEAQTDPDPDEKNVIVQGLVSNYSQVSAGWASSIVGDEIGLDYYMGIELPSTLRGLNVADGTETTTITPADPSDLLGALVDGYGITVELQLLTLGSESSTSGSVDVVQVAITYNQEGGGGPDNDTVNKWELYDFVTDSTLEFEINPSDAKMPGIARNITEQGTTSPSGNRILFEGRRSPQTISISGVVLTQDQYEVLETWSNKRYQLKLTDDLLREYWVYIKEFSPTRRSTKIGSVSGGLSSKLSWLADYSIEMEVLDWSS